MANQIVWADIPVKDLDRAVKFFMVKKDSDIAPRRR
jgi:predicted enzyme related to lactoylglutathione lyase